MATPPTRVTGFTPAVGWTSNASPKTSPTFDVAAGDLIVIIGFTENSTSTINVPTWTGTGAVTLRQSITVTNYCTAYLWTVDVTATATGRTISATRGGQADTWSFYGSVWRNHGGLGVTGKTNVASGAPALVLATAANSAIVCGNSDWTASSPTGRTWRSVNGAPMVETSQGGLAGTTYECYTGYTLDSGPAGNVTVGMLTPSAQKYSIVGAEILGTSSGSPALVAAPAWTSTAAMLAPTVAGGTLPVPATVTPTVATASATALAPSVTGLQAAMVNAPLASASAAALPPTATGLKTATVTAPAATASAAMPPPTVQGLGGAVVAPSAMTAISAALAPTVTGNRIAVVQAPAATAGALAPTPTVTGLRAAVVNAVTALANAVMNAPAIITGGQAVVQAPLMGATATAPPPSVIGFKMATVMAPTGTATAVMPAPTYSLYLEALVRPALGSASAEWAPPAVSVGVYITAPIIAATAALLAPSVTNGSHVSTTPDGELVAYLIPSNRVDARLIERVDRVVAYLIPRKTGP
jgi:hypothetical protein